MAINDKIKAAIKRQGFTLSSVAKRMHGDRAGEIGISQPALSNMLKGNIPFSRVEEIAEIIGLTIIDIIQDGEPSHGATCPHCGQPITITIN